VPKEHHVGIVTRNIEKASGLTNLEQTAKVSSEALAGSVYFKADTLMDGEYPIAAIPSFGLASLNNAGIFWVPKVGDEILIEIDSAVNQPEPRYICSLYTTEIVLYRDFKKNYPWRMGWVSNSGHKLIFDDLTKEEQIYLEHMFGHRLGFSKDGSIFIESRKVTSRDSKDELKDQFDPDWFKMFFDYTNKLMNLRYQETDEVFFDMKWDRTNKKASYRYEYVAGEFGDFSIDGNAKKMEFTDHHGNIISIDQNGVKITDKSANIVEMKAAGITVTVNGKAEINASGDVSVVAGGKAEVQGATVELNGSVGQVLTNITDPVIDLITGAPTTGVPIVLAG